MSEICIHCKKTVNFHRSFIWCPDGIHQFQEGAPSPTTNPTVPTPPRVSKRQESNIHEEFHRLEKVVKLMDHLRTFNITSELAVKMDAQQWNQVAVTAGVNPPSDQTKEQVIARLKSSEEMAKAIKSGYDPFKRFGK